MPLTYTGTDGLFTHLGKLVKHYNLFQTDATNLDADRDEILDAFQASDLDVTIDGLVGAYQRWKAEYAARRGELAAFALARLQDKDSVLDEIKAATTDQDEILRKLIETMDEDNATVKRSTVSIASTAAGMTPVWPTMSGLAKLMIPKRGLSSPQALTKAADAWGALIAGLWS